MPKVEEVVCEPVPLDGDVDVVEVFSGLVSGEEVVVGTVLIVEYTIDNIVVYTALGSVEATTVTVGLEYGEGQVVVV